MAGTVNGFYKDTISKLNWSVKKGPLNTRWAADIDPLQPHPEYPRPQLARKEWTNLNGVWEYQPGSVEDVPSFGQRLKSQILVPFPVESALSGVMEHHDRLWYRRTFRVPSSWKTKQVMLHFGAVDYEAEVFLNGDRIGFHRGGYDPFSYNITPSLVAVEEQELIVRVFDPTEKGGQPRGKQTTTPEGIMYTPTTGIWQTVWIEPVPLAYIEDLSMVPDIDHGCLELTVRVLNADRGTKAHVMIKDGGRLLEKRDVVVNEKTRIPIADAKLWSPDAPFLYDINVSLSKDGDSVASYFGMRKISVGKVENQWKMMLNNQPLFQLGPLDQGFWPDGVYTAPTDAALKNDIETMKAMGFNMVRKHIKVEPARWYYWADKLGILVWQDMPSANSYPLPGVIAPPVDKTAFEQELKRMIETHHNSPSIVVWTIFNETQGQHDTGHLVKIVQMLDPSRLVNEASGGDITGAGDINDVHAYPEPSIRSSTPKQAMVCGEYGGIGYLIENHSWAKRGKGYTDIETVPDLLCLYADFVDQLRVMREAKNLSAAVYTQLTDVETEVNGLMTYDRILKAKPEAFARINRFQFVKPDYRALLPTSDTTPQRWKYTLTKPNGSWFGKDFDDSRWSEGKGEFGNRGAGTIWNSSGIWLRMHFNPGELTSGQLNDVVTRDVHIGNADVFINGVPSFSLRRSSIGYEIRAMKQAARDTIKGNSDNILAVYCQPREGFKTQVIDLGVYLREKMSV